ncbi:MAG: hypothetical protein H0X37_26595 [Herpetosiphonaceae bacterium]|nr:hypothetical protein [Herpetosiphonaceae bacterium]
MHADILMNPEPRFIIRYDPSRWLPFHDGSPGDWQVVQFRLPSRDGVERQVQVELHHSPPLALQVIDARIIYATTNRYSYAVWQTERVLRVHELQLVATMAEETRS